MAITPITTYDSKLNAYISQLQHAEYGIEARGPLANALSRCYQLAMNENPSGEVLTHIDRIRNAVFGEEVRDALKMGLSLCYTVKGLPVSSSENSVFQYMTECISGTDLQYYMAIAIQRCAAETR